MMETIQNIHKLPGIKHWPQPGPDPCMSSHSIVQQDEIRGIKMIIKISEGKICTLFRFSHKMKIG